MYDLKCKPTKLLSTIAVACTFGLSASVAAATLEDIQQQWSKCQYDVFNKDNKVACFEQVITDNQTALNKDPGRNDLKVWLAINKSSLAGAKGGLGALSLVKESKKLLEDVINKEPEVLDGSAFTSLGSLYYKVPGWPIGFGDDDMAETMLKKALAINPNGIDPNYFYGDFLAEDGRKAQAVAYLKKAQQAKPRLNRELADRGRQQEISNRLNDLQ
ncbi:hypothetical protein [Photobacterium sp.]|uniref:tetratricopeptide repeat protein n=1 Tax=Photobacterium sp. TaxID=660 RepID=UPI00299E82CD|nr:hypothetical protein [Photobacterium sp.]MDX1302229.1 hypothetical protein [Photobacterium sp.]